MHTSVINIVSFVLQLLMSNILQNESNLRRATINYDDCIHKWIPHFIKYSVVVIIIVIVIVLVVLTCLRFRLPFDLLWCLVWLWKPRLTTFSQCTTATLYTKHRHAWYLSVCLLQDVEFVHHQKFHRFQIVIRLANVIQLITM